MPTFPPPFGVLPIGAATYTAAATVSERLLLLSPRDSDAATLVASSSVSGLPASNLQGADPAKKWRSNGTTSASFTLAFAVPVMANALAIVGHNLSDVAVVRVRGAALLANVTAAPDIDSGWQSAWPASGKPVASSWPQMLTLARWANTTFAAYYQVDIADPSPTVTYLEAARLVLGAYWQPTSANFDMGGTPLGFDTTDVQLKTRYGRLFTDKSADSAARTFELNCYAFDKREAFDGLYEVRRLRGMWGDVICSLDPGETTDFHRFAMQGVFSDAPAYTLPPVFNDNGSMFGAAIRLRELI